MIYGMPTTKFGLGDMARLTQASQPYRNRIGIITGRTFHHLTGDVEYTIRFTDLPEPYTNPVTLHHIGEWALRKPRKSR